MEQIIWCATCLADRIVEFEPKARIKLGHATTVSASWMKQILRREIWLVSTINDVKPKLHFGNSATILNNNIFLLHELALVAIISPTATVSAPHMEKILRCRIWLVATIVNFPVLLDNFFLTCRNLFHLHLRLLNLLCLYQRSYLFSAASTLTLTLTPWSLSKPKSVS